MRILESHRRVLPVALALLVFRFVVLIFLVSFVSFFDYPFYFYFYNIMIYLHILTDTSSETQKCKCLHINYLFFYLKSILF